MNQRRTQAMWWSRTKGISISPGEASSSHLPRGRVQARHTFGVSGWGREVGCSSKNGGTEMLAFVFAWGFPRLFPFGLPTQPREGMTRQCWWSCGGFWDERGLPTRVVCGVFQVRETGGGRLDGQNQLDLTWLEGKATKCKRKRKKATTGPAYAWCLSFFG